MSNQIQYWSDMTTLDSHHGESVYENIYNVINVTTIIQKHYNQSLYVHH